MSQSGATVGSQTSEASAGSNAEPQGRPGDPLPSLAVGMPPEAVIAKLDHMARRGRLPGFERTGPSTFEAAAFGAPFDRTLVGRAVDAGAGTSRVDLTTRLQWKAPLIMIAAIAFTIWPGVWLTDSLMATYFRWYPTEFWVTAAWYLPLTVLPLPWIGVRIWRKSEREARASAEKAIEKIAAEVQARVAGER